MIVGNDQEGDDSVITAHVSLFAVSSFIFFPFFVSFFIKLFGKAKHCCHELLLSLSTLWK